MDRRHDRIFNFSPGPAMLAAEVLQTARDEALDWHGSGMSVMEISHRGPEFTEILRQTEADLRALMAIPHNYKVLFLQGGATTQFTAVPLNLLRARKSADYVETGEWSKKAIAEAQRYCQVNIAASSRDANFSYAPAQEKWRLDPQAAYVHYTPNETIGGVEFNWTPDTNDVALVADMSSSILSRPIDVSRFAVIYAGAQKNIGPSGLTIVIVREDLIGHAAPQTPVMLDWRIQAENDSMYNTPPTYPIYMAGLTFQWLKKQGGVAAIEKINIAKARLLYDQIDASDFYRCPVAKSDRSRMNVAFTLQDSSLDGEFLRQAEERGLLQLKGHRAVGGMRASLYNAMPVAGVQALVDFMRDFERRQG
ncbi:MAG: 3-phosphoserine/phosphohydroxythreonine transaminase [Burkholderiales bacterium]|nr:3-phosphoserine/phosphohydroxythreonine transaminase [Burkholderiales bacterium]